MRAGQRAKVAFLMEMTEQPEGAGTMSYLEVPPDQAKHRFKDHEDNILENEKLRRPGLQKEGQGEPVDLEVFPAPLAEAAPLD